MPTAYVLINCRLGNEAEIITELRRVPGVVEANVVYGLYDIVTRITMDTDEKLETILRDIRRIENIISTNTLIKIEGQG